MSKMHTTRLQRAINPSLAFALIAAFFALVGYVPLAAAHAKLMASEPAADAVVASPQEVVLTFSQAATPLQVKLTDLQTKIVSELAPPKVDGKAFHYQVGRVLAPGKYEISYRVVTPDTHVSSGIIAFSVSAAGVAK